LRDDGCYAVVVDPRGYIVLQSFFWAGNVCEEGGRASVMQWLDKERGWVALVVFGACES
jgi:hypothetical protein